MPQSAKHMRAIGPQKGDPSRNHLGCVSKEKAQLRRLFEEFIVKDSRILIYLKELHDIATEDNSPRMRLEAIKILLDKALGKDFHVTGDVIKDIKIEIITTKEGEGSDHKD